METRKPVLLAVSFGTSFAKTRTLTIEATEKALAAAFPDFELRRAFTSAAIIRKLRERDGVRVCSLEEALEQLAREGTGRVLVQPTHMMPGREYDALQAQAQRFRPSFRQLTVGPPLLHTQEDCRELAQILLEKTRSFLTPDTAMIWMGHGSAHPGNAVYTTVQEAFQALGHSRQLVGTVKGTPDISDTLRRTRALGVSRVVLQPMMLVAGEHAAHDMAGPQADSWKNQFLRAGFQVECVLEGVGQYAEVQAMIVRHARCALAEALDFAGNENAH